MSGQQATGRSAVDATTERTADDGTDDEGALETGGETDAGTVPETPLRVRQDLAGRTCLVTGGSRGIGRAIALELGRRGAEVVCTYRSSERAAQAVADEISELPTDGDGHRVQVDVGDGGSVETMREGVHDAVGTVDVLVNNAGVTSDRLFADLSEEAWTEVLDVNLTGAYRCTRAFYDDVRESEAGRIVNVASVVGKQGNVGQANYAAAKSGLFGFTRTLALELAPADATANCVAPGFTRTDMLEAVPEDVQDRIRSKIPLDRFADPEEVAAVVGFLASDAAAYVTGEVIDVTGGYDL